MLLGQSRNPLAGKHCQVGNQAASSLLRLNDILNGTLSSGFKRVSLLCGVIGNKFFTGLHRVFGALQGFALQE